MTMTLVSTITVGAGGAASIEFTGIPQDGTDLLLVVSARTNAASHLGNLQFFINNLTTGVSERRLLGSGSSVSSSSATESIIFYANGNTSTASTFGNMEIYIPNYAGAIAKSYSGNVVTENNATAAAQVLIAGSQSSTAAVTSVKLAPWPSGTILENSTASIYKITKFA